MNNYVKNLVTLSDLRYDTMSKLPNVDKVELSTWRAAVKAILVPAYDVASKQYNAMIDGKKVDVNKTAFFDAVRNVITLIGEVRGAKLNSEDFEPIIGKSMGREIITTHEDSAHAVSQLSEARKALNNYNGEDESVIESMQKSVDKWQAEIDRMSGLVGYFKSRPKIVSESAFEKAATAIFADVVAKQYAKTVEEVLAEKKAREDARKANNKVKKAKSKAKKAESKKADATTLPTMNDIPAEELNK